MAFVVAVLQPVLRKNLSAVSRHNSRSGELQLHIDKKRSFYNQTLMGESDVFSDVSDEISLCDMARKSKDSGEDKVAAEIVLSFSPDWLDLQDGMQYEDVDRLFGDKRFLEWLERSKKFLQAHGCIHADLHMDEKTPHIHGILSVKVKRESKAKTEKSAKRSKKSEYVLNFNQLFGAKDNVEFKLMKASHSPKTLADLEKKYERKYNPAETKLGKLQTEYADLMADLGLDRGRSVVETGARHSSKYDWEQKKKREEEEKRHQEELEKIETEHKKQIVQLEQNFLKEQEEKKAEILAIQQQEIQNLISQNRQRIEEEKKRIEKQTRLDLAKFKNEKKAENDQEKVKIIQKMQQEIDCMRKKAKDIIENEKKETENKVNQLVSDFTEIRSECNSLVSEIISRFNLLIPTIKDTINILFEKLEGFCNFDFLRKNLIDVRFSRNQEVIDFSHGICEVSEKIDKNFAQLSKDVSDVKEKIKKIQENYTNYQSPNM